MRYWSISDWQQAYCKQGLDIQDLYEYVQQLHEQIHLQEASDDHAWISLASSEQLRLQIEALANRSPAQCPLYGIPFAVKDNIDVAGFYSTAACPAAAYLAEQDATVVAKLKQAGAIVIGKTNLDQFATGLVGVRSPYGAVKNSFNPDYISGGSSSGSAVLVARGVVPFALGTDTAGSGRIPAGLNNIVGLKPSKGWFSTHGVVPACRTLDVISIFALTVRDAWQVAQSMQGYDALDDYSREHPCTSPTRFSKGKIAIPDQLEFYDDAHSKAAFDVAIARAQDLGYAIETIDFSAFNALAAALYNQAWVAERQVAIQARAATSDLHPVIAQIVAQADAFSAVDAMQAEYNRARLARQIQQQLAAFDALMVPTAPTVFTIAEVEADPLRKNSQMGAYTNFVNLADLSALALPNVIRVDGLPSGVTFISLAWHDQALAHFGVQWQAATALPLGCSMVLPQKNSLNATAITSHNSVRVAVVGAHLTGMPLNFQLTTRAAVRVCETTTASCYKLYALNNTTPPKPGLQYCMDAAQGHAIAVEVWDVPLASFGKLVAEVPAPLGIGNIQLANGDWVKGFICEGYALDDALDISAFGGWRAYIQSQQLALTAS